MSALIGRVATWCPGTAVVQDFNAEIVRVDLDGDRELLAGVARRAVDHRIGRQFGQAECRVVGSGESLRDLVKEATGHTYLISATGKASRPTHEGSLGRGLAQPGLLWLVQMCQDLGPTGARCEASWRLGRQTPVPDQSFDGIHRYIL